MTVPGRFPREENRIPITGHGLVVENTLTFSGDDATVATPVFDVTGLVEVKKIGGVVLVALGANQTDCHFRINDHTATDQIITKATTLTLSSAPIGSYITKTGLITAVATYKSSAAANFYEPTTLQTELFTPFIVGQKTGDIVTHIEWLYTTTDDPTSGSIEFFVGYLPLSDGAKIEADDL